MKGGDHNSIRVKAMCLITDGRRVLVSRSYGKVKKETFYRVLGGSLHFGELAEDGMQREIEEELGCKIENPSLVDVIENVFVYEGRRGHEIVFLFKGYLRDPKLCNKESVHITEDDYEFDAEWIPIDDITNKKVILYPEYDYSIIS